MIIQAFLDSFLENLPITIDKNYFAVAKELIKWTEKKLSFF